MIDNLHNYAEQYTVKYYLFVIKNFLRIVKFAIMPDVHAGKGCTVGTTMTINDKIIPDFVGVGIGCGVLYVKLAEKDLIYQS